MDRTCGRRLPDERNYEPSLEANLPWQPTAAAHSFGRPHLQPAETGIYGDFFEQPYLHPQAVFVREHPAHSAAAHSFVGQPHLQPAEHGMDGDFFEPPYLHPQAALFGTLFEPLHSQDGWPSTGTGGVFEQPQMHSQQPRLWPTAAVDGSSFRQQHASITAAVLLAADGCRNGRPRDTRMHWHFGAACEPAARG